MKLPKTDTPEKYVGLYVIDFDGQCAMGYTAPEVASLLESEKFPDAKVYKIYRVRPDETLQLHGVSRARFNLESGMFFHCRQTNAGQQDYQNLLTWSQQQQPPCRAKLQLARGADDILILALIYPAEYEQEMGAWVQDSGFRGSGAVDAGPSQVTRYYENDLDVIERSQLIPANTLQTRTREELLASTNTPLQRRFA